MMADVAALAAEMNAFNKEEKAQYASDTKQQAGKNGSAAPGTNDSNNDEPPKFDPNQLLEGYTVTNDYVEKLGKERVLYPDLIIQQHIITLIAESGSGKTAFCYRHVAPTLAKQGLNVWYLDADSPASDHLEMKRIADKSGFKFLNPDTNQGTSVDGLIESLRKIADSDADLTDWVFFIDTVKKFCDLLQKQQVKKFFALCRKLAAMGATIVLLGHANKYRNADCNLVFEGTNDVKSDTDELIFFERTINPNGGIDITTVVDPDKGAKVRGIFKPFSFNISPGREISFYSDPLPVVDRTRSAAAKATDGEILDAAVEHLTEMGGPVLQRDLAGRVSDMTGAGVSRVRKLIVQNSERKDSEVKFGHRLQYTRGDNNKYLYTLPVLDERQFFNAPHGGILNN